MGDGASTEIKYKKKQSLYIPIRCPKGSRRLRLPNLQNLST
jgi:hypothetical protein